jgi:hypothetical protein
MYSVGDDVEFKAYRLINELWPEKKCLTYEIRQATLDAISVQRARPSTERAMAYGVLLDSGVFG